MTKTKEIFKIFLVSENIPIFAVLSGAMAERLGTGLQNLVQRFDSASHLKNKRAVKRLSFFAPDSLRHAYAYLLLIGEKDRF